MLSSVPVLKEMRTVVYIQHHLWTQTEMGRVREGERLVSHEREESNSKVKRGSRRTNNTDSTDRGARSKEGAIERGE